MNEISPDFTVHIGDTKSGSTPCSDEELSNQLDFMNSFSTALVYTPGDNEWTDCYRERAGEFDPLERLAKIRELYFASNQSLGQKPIENITRLEVFGAEQMHAVEVTVDPSTPDVFGFSPIYNPAS
ncbi:MAG: hypothetical protein ACFB6S_17815 [Geminicoccaceae bacterium]